MLQGHESRIFKAHYFQKKLKKLTIFKKNMLSIYLLFIGSNNIK